MAIELESLVQTVLSQGANWEVGETSLTSLSEQDLLLRLGYTPGPSEPSLAERESFALANLQ